MRPFIARAYPLAALLVAAGCSDSSPSPAPDTGVDTGADADTTLDADTDTTSDVDSDTADVAQDADAIDDTTDVETDAGDADADADATPGPTTCTGAPSDTIETYPLGDWTVGVDTGSGAWGVTPPHGGDPVLFAPPTCDEDGRSTIRVARGAPHVLNEFGAFRITLEGGRSALDWRNVTGPPTDRQATADELALVYDVAGDDEPLRLVFSVRGDDLEVSLVGSFDAGEIVWEREDDEAMFGLGTQVTGMDLTGRTYPLWTQEQGNGKPEDPLAWPLQGEPEAAYAPMGVWHSSAGWSALVTHDAFSEIDLGHADPDRSALRSFAALPGFVLLRGAEPRDRITALTEYTGRLLGEPAPWTFGSWNDSVGGGERLREVAGILRDNQIPSSAIWSEDWIGGSQSGTGYRLSYAWEWDEATYPDLPDDIAFLHDTGFAFLAYFNTFVPQPTRMWEEGLEGGYLMVREDGTPRTVQDPAFRTAGLVDLTNPDATAWFRGYMDTAAVTLGIDGWMADFTEWAPVDAVLHDGTDPWHFHNRYPLYFQRLNTAALSEAHADGDEPANNWSYFARSGWASVNGGSGGIIPTLWGGDQNTNWDYDDGYPTVVPIAAHAGLSGVAIFGSDVGGYNALFGEATDKELFMRWSSMAAFHPLMRTHHGSNECANWSFDRDPETLAHYRRYASIHSHLYPVFRSLAEESRTTGWPIIRHPWFVAPDAPELWQGDQFQFFLGDDLLVAPVLTEGATDRTVTLPGDGWWPLLGDAPAVSSSLDGFVATVSSDATEIPVFVRPGVAIPLLAETVHTFYGDPDTPGVVSLDDVTGLRFALYPDSDGAVASIEYDGSSVTGSGWDNADFASPTWNDAALPECNDVGPEADCRDPESRAVRVFGPGTLVAGAAELAITGPDGRANWIAVAGDAWSPWNTPTALTDLDPDIPPPCEEE